MFRVDELKTGDVIAIKNLTTYLYEINNVSRCYKLISRLEVRDDQVAILFVLNVHRNSHGLSVNFICEGILANAVLLESSITKLT